MKAMKLPMKKSKIPRKAAAPAVPKAMKAKAASMAHAEFSLWLLEFFFMFYVSEKKEFAKINDMITDGTCLAEARRSDLWAWSALGSYPTPERQVCVRAFFQEKRQRFSGASVWVDFIAPLFFSSVVGGTFVSVSGACINERDIDERVLDARPVEQSWSSERNVPNL